MLKQQALEHFSFTLFSQRSVKGVCWRPKELQVLRLNCSTTKHAGPLKNVAELFHCRPVVGSESAQAASVSSHGGLS